MPIKSEKTPPPRIGKIGPYTVFVTPPTTPNPSLKPDSPKKPVDAPVQVQTPVQKVVQPPPVMAPPVQYCEDKSVFAFFWDAVAKVQSAHARLDEHVAHWFGLNQSKYQWALDDYSERNGKITVHYGPMHDIVESFPKIEENQTEAKAQNGMQNV